MIPGYAVVQSNDCFQYDPRDKSTVLYSSDYSGMAAKPECMQQIHQPRVICILQQTQKHCIVFCEEKASEILMGFFFFWSFSR